MKRNVNMSEIDFHVPISPDNVCWQNQQLKNLTFPGRDTDYWNLQPMQKLFLPRNEVFMFVCLFFFFFKTSYLYKFNNSLLFIVFVQLIIFNLLIETLVVVWVIESVKRLRKYVYMEFFFTFFSITVEILKCEYSLMVDNASNEPDDSSSNSNWNSLHSLRTNAFGISLLLHNR